MSFKNTWTSFKDDSTFSAFKSWHNQDRTLLPPTQLYMNEMWGLFYMLLSDQTFVFQMDHLNFHVHAIFGVCSIVAIRATGSMDMSCLEENKMKIVISYNP